MRAAAPSGTAAFELSGAFGAWRIVGPHHGWQIDVMPLHADGLEADLRARDLTINAIAEPLGGGEPLDPTGGIGDLRAGRLRMVGATSFCADPARVLRVARLAVELGMQPDEDTVAAARAQAGALRGVAGERVFAELRRTIDSDDALRGVALLEQLGAAAAVLPELEALRGVDQTVYHHLDVHDHTLEVLEQAIALQRDPSAVLGPGRGEGVAAALAEPLADGLTRGGALRWGALLHDIAKPLTRTDFGGGRVGFPHHDREGARMSRAILERLRTSERLRAHVAALARHHLRLGFLVHERPLDRRAVYRYLSACEPVGLDVTLLTIADRLATRGRKADEAIAAHLEIALPMVDEALAWRAAGPPKALIHGDVLASKLGIEPGPQLGALLAQIAEARFAGEVDNAQDAVALARTLLEQGS